MTLIVILLTYQHLPNLRNNYHPVLVEDESKLSRWDDRYKTGSNPDFLKMRQSTVEIKMGRQGGAGTIVMIDDQYLYILTAQHGMNSKIMIQAKDIEGKRHLIKNIPTKNIIKHKNVDLALIKAPRPNAEFQYFKLADKAPLIGERIYTIGHPANTYYSVHEGLISSFSYRTFNNHRAEYTMISAPSWGGNSGGAVINEKTELVGIAVGILYVGTNPKDYKNTVYLFHMTYAVSYEKILDFMYDNGLIMRIQ